MRTGTIGAVRAGTKSTMRAVPMGSVRAGTEVTGPMRTSRAAATCEGAVNTGNFPGGADDAEFFGYPLIKGLSQIGFGIAEADNFRGCCTHSCDIRLTGVQKGLQLILFDKKLITDFTKFGGVLFLQCIILGALFGGESHEMMRSHFVARAGTGLSLDTCCEKQDNESHERYNMFHKFRAERATSCFHVKVDKEIPNQ